MEKDDRLKLKDTHYYLMKGTKMIKELNYPIPWQETWNITDGSKLKTFMECPRQYFYEYIFGWRPTSPNNHLIFGSAWHKAQEYLLLNGYTLESVNNAMFLFMNEYRKEIPEESDELYAPKTPSNALRALEQYIDHYLNDLSKWEVLYTEISGTVLINEEDIMHFRMDSILEEVESGKKLSLDHKTGSRMGRTWTDQWALDVSMGLYTHVLYCLYPEEEVKGVKVRGTFFYKSGEAKFEDVPLWKTKGQMEIWLTNVNFWYQQLKQEFYQLSHCTTNDRVLNAFPMQPGHCTKWYGCPYHDFCISWGNPLTRFSEEPPMGFKVEHWDPREGDPTHKMEIR